MPDMTSETVLVVCNDSALADELLESLFRNGVNAVGPVDSARMALAIATHSQPTLAVIANPPTGRRGAVELAQVLERDWGIRSWILDDAVSERDRTAGDLAWAADPRQIEGLRRVLGRADEIDAVCL
jgi:hypothetical protein